MKNFLWLFALLFVEFDSAAATVTVTNDSGPGSLRQALTDADTDPGLPPHLIQFNIPGDGPHTIAPLTQFPTNTQPVLIDGYTQPGASPNTLSNGFNAVIKIRVVGTSNGSFQPTAFRLQNGSTVRGLAIVLWNNKTGIEIISGGSSNTVAGCLIGIDVDGSQKRASIGLHIRNSPGNQIGGPAPADRNVISYNFSHGIFIEGTSASNNVVLGNFIGTDFNGAIARANFGSGVEVLDAPGNIIGGLETGAGNLISGNQNGVRIRGFGSARGNIIRGNFIGTSVSGTAALANNADGLVIENAQETIVGGSMAGARNVISGNTAYGINISTTTTTGTSIQGNLIGAGITGAALPNGGAFGPAGIVISGSSNLIGGVLAGEANVIAFNRGRGVNIGTGTQNQIRGNSIHSNTTTFPPWLGIDLGNDNITVNDVGDGDTGANNRQNYPLITSATGNSLTTAVQGTLNSNTNQTFQLDFYGNTTCDPSGNGEGQFYLGSGTVLTDGSGNGAFNTVLSIASPGQFITATATDPFGNTSEFSPCFQATIAVPPMTFTVVNTNDAGAGSLRQAILDSNNHLSSENNTIAFNITGGGLQVIRPSTALPTFIRPVTIDGFTQPGASANTLSNGNNANWLIELNGSLAGANQYGLRLSIPNLVVRGLRITRFSNNGIEITSTNNAVGGNFVHSNSSGGIYLNVAGANRIGGAGVADRNVISANSGRGVEIFLGTNNMILGNFIGTDATGTAALGSQDVGVSVFDGVNNLIGGVAPGAANWIAFNGSSGVFIQTGTNNAVRGNRFFSNGGLGIDLWFSGVTPNDTGDGDTGANNIQNFPILTNGTANQGSTVIQGTLNSRPNTTYDLDFYSSAVCSSSSRQGQTYLGSASVVTDGSGDVQFNVNIPATAFGSFLTATATDPNGNTSEFSPCLAATFNLPPATFVVVNTNDSGAGSLRQAIVDVGATPNVGADSIHFNIPGPGPHRVNLLTPLPSPSQPVIIDGYSQPGASVNTANTNDNAVLKIQLDGAQMGSALDALIITNANNVIRGLSFTRFPALPLRLQGHSNLIDGNWIGVDPSGAAAGNSSRGIIISSSGNLIGGASPGARNIIAANGNDGVLFQSASASNNVVQGNYIGVGASGMNPLPNAGDGIELNQARNNFIGGTNAGAGNVIAAWARVAFARVQQCRTPIRATRYSTAFCHEPPPTLYMACAAAFLPFV